MDIAAAAGSSSAYNPRRSAGGPAMLLLTLVTPSPPMDPRIWAALPRNILHKVVERLPVTSLLDWLAVDTHWRNWLRTARAEGMLPTATTHVEDQGSCMLVYGCHGTHQPPSLQPWLRCHRLGIGFLPPGSRPVSAHGGLVLFLVGGNPRLLAVCNVLTRQWVLLPEVAAECALERPRITRADIKVLTTMVSMVNMVNGDAAGGATHTYRVAVDVARRTLQADDGVEVFGSSQARELWLFRPQVGRWKEFQGTDRQDDYLFLVPGGHRGANSALVVLEDKKRVYSLGSIHRQIATATIHLSPTGVQKQHIARLHSIPAFRGKEADFHKLLLLNGRVFLVGYNIVPFWLFVWEMDFVPMAWTQIAFLDKNMACGKLLPPSFWLWYPDGPDERRCWDSVGIATLGDMVCVSLLSHRMSYLVAYDVVTRIWRSWDFCFAHSRPAIGGTVQRLSILSMTPSLTASPHLDPGLTTPFPAPAPDVHGIPPTSAPPPPPPPPHVVAAPGYGILEQPMTQMLRAAVAVQAAAPNPPPGPRSNSLAYAMGGGQGEHPAAPHNAPASSSTTTDMAGQVSSTTGKRTRGPGRPRRAAAQLSHAVPADFTNSPAPSATQWRTNAAATMHGGPVEVWAAYHHQHPHPLGAHFGQDSILSSSSIKEGADGDLPAQGDNAPGMDTEIKQEQASPTCPRRSIRRKKYKR